jgi:hypothetical protein
VSAVLAEARAAGLSTIRWWMFTGEPTQFLLDEAGLPIGLRPEVAQDVDAALALARAHDIRFVFTLFSSPSAIPSAWRDTPTGREQLVAVLSTLFQRYAADDRIMTWQVMNEPEWEIWSGEVDGYGVLELVRMVTAAVHATSTALVSVGGARLDGLPMWIGTGLDYFTVHWYDPMGAVGCVPCTTYDDLRRTYGITEPVVVGELFLGVDVDALERVNDLEARGYAGAWGWSLLPDRTEDRLDVDLLQLRSFVQPEDDAS